MQCICPYDLKALTRRYNYVRKGLLHDLPTLAGIHLSGKHASLDMDVKLLVLVHSVFLGSARCYSFGRIHLFLFQYCMYTCFKKFCSNLLFSQKGKCLSQFLLVHNK